MVFKRITRLTSAYFFGLLALYFFAAYYDAKHFAQRHGLETALREDFGRQAEREFSLLLYPERAPLHILNRMTEKERLERLQTLNKALNIIDGRSKKKFDPDAYLASH